MLTLQATTLVSDTGSYPFTTRAPLVALENVPQTVTPDTPFTVRAVSYGLDGAQAPGAGYLVTPDNGSDVTADGAGDATLTLTGGGYHVIDARQPADAEGNAPRALTRSVCVYDGSSGSPCAGALSAVSVGFGTQARGTIGAATPVVVTPASGRVTVASAKLISGDADDFLLTSDDCTGTTVHSGTGATTPTCSVRVRFAPSVAGSRTAVLRVTSTATNGPLDVTLTGTGGAPVLAPPVRPARTAPRATPERRAPPGRRARPAPTGRRAHLVPRVQPGPPARRAMRARTAAMRSARSSAPSVRRRSRAS